MCFMHEFGWYLFPSSSLPPLPPSFPTCSKRGRPSMSTTTTGLPVADSSSTCSTYKRERRGERRREGGREGGKKKGECT